MHMPAIRLDQLPNFNFDLPKYLPRIVGVLLFLWIVKSAIVFIPPGYVAALYDRGVGVLDRELTEGINIIIPWWQSAQLFDTRIQEYTMAVNKNEGALRTDDSLDAPTSDGQTVKVDVTVLFRIDPAKASTVWKTIGVNYVDKIVRPITRSQARMVISRYTAPAIYSEKRQEAESVMQNEISALFKDKNIILDKLLLRAVNFSPEYSRAIEAKVIAEQKVKQATYEVLEADQRAQSKIAEAKGLAEAQALQKQSLTQEYLQLEAIKKWDGKLPDVVGNGSVPFINLPLNR